MSKKYFIPPFANLAEHPCDFKTFLIHRTVDALQLAIGCPFPLKMRDFLYREFDACENVRMDVSFAVTYSQKLLKEELTHANVKSLWLLRFFRTIMNLLLGHMNAGINADNTALQTLLEWVCHHYGYFSDEAMLTVEDDPFPQTPIGRVCRNRRFGAERLAPPLVDQHLTVILTLLVLSKNKRKGFHLEDASYLKRIKKRKKKASMHLHWLIHLLQK